MRSYVTSYVSLFDQEDAAGRAVDTIEIPRIQRDYAQGRLDASTSAIRETFLDVLCAAVTGGEPVGLDFVYGEMERGTLSPLDGQQRLTTLFLLHWYLATTTGRLIGDEKWMRFSYATRPSARMFCERLAKVSLPHTEQKPSTWLTDQPWYLYLWRLDPTIQSMLVVIDAIHDRLVTADRGEAWRRLVDSSDPAISFDFLPIEDMASPDDLYIKMNSRGKPLTEFENFKARLQKALDASPRAEEVAHKIDGDWSDVLWPRHGGDNVVDDEFLNYILFVIELCEWRRGDTEARRHAPITRAELTFATGQPDAISDLAFLVSSFDTWVDQDIDAFFDQHFAAPESGDPRGQDRLVIFGTDVNPNLFEACIRDLGNEQKFGSQRKLLLYAVLLHRIHGTDDFPRRLRIVRNLLAASEDELRPQAMSQIVLDVELVVMNGEVDGVVGLNQAQRSDEIKKRTFLNEHPEVEHVVFRLEDHDLLRGSLVAIDLDAKYLEERAMAFDETFAEDELTSLTGALLALGQYQRSIGSSSRFGAPRPTSRWRELLTGADHEKLAPTRAVLSAALDQLRGAGPPRVEKLQSIWDDWLHEQDREMRFGWRYYLVRYPEMRIGKSGIYRTADGTMGYSLCMLEGEYLNGYYRDPYLQAIVGEADAADFVVGADKGGPWFIGHASNERWLELKKSATRLRVVQAGFELKAPPLEEHWQSFDRLLSCRDDVELSGDRYLFAIPQANQDGDLVDTIDRVQVGATLVRDLVAAGC